MIVEKRKGLFSGKSGWRYAYVLGDYLSIYACIPVPVYIVGFRVIS